MAVTEERGPEDPELLRRRTALDQRDGIWPPVCVWSGDRRFWHYQEPFETDDRVRQVRQRCAEVCAWFEQNPPGDDLALSTRPSLMQPSWPEQRPTFSSIVRDEAKAMLQESMVSSVSDKRATALGGADEGDLPVGCRFLVYLPEEEMADGAAAWSSGGLFDDNDEPGWATWMDYYDDIDLGSRLLCCIPPCLVEAAQAGIDANPICSIHWVRCPELLA